MAATADLITMGAALSRGVDLQRLPARRRILELETDRAALVAPQARRTPTPQGTGSFRTVAHNATAGAAEIQASAAERPSSRHALRVSPGTPVHPGCDSAIGWWISLTCGLQSGVTARDRCAAIVG